MKNDLFWEGEGGVFRNISEAQRICKSLNKKFNLYRDIQLQMR